MTSEPDIELTADDFIVLTEADIAMLKLAMTARADGTHYSVFAIEDDDE
jgi:rRNA maturation endonuclease Nob1